jgi:hypothetical protein
MVKNLVPLSAVPLLLALLTTAPGCVSANGEGITDSGVFIPTVRAHQDLFGGKRGKPHGRFKDGEAGISGTGGNAEGTSYTLLDVYLAGRYGTRSKRGGIWGLGGIAFSHFDMRPQGFSRITSNRVGLMLGGQGELYFLKSRKLKLYGRGTYTFLPDVAGSSQAEIGVGWELRKDLDVIVGWRWWLYEEEEFFGNIDAKVETTGFVLGLEFGF